MAPLRMGPQAGLQLTEAAPLRRAREEGLVQIRRREPADTPNDDLLAFLVPLERRAWTDAESPPNDRRNRNPTVRSESRPCNGHRHHRLEGTPWVAVDGGENIVG
jgi:hypothetical protein